MNISQELLATNHSKITIELSKEDYLPQVNKSLKDYAKKVSIKGFRAGKVPPGIVKSMYGSEIMGEEISKILMDTLYKYLEDEKIETLGNPIPQTEDRPIIDIKEPKDFTFNYEIGLNPDIEIPLLNDEDITFTKYKITVADDLVNEEIEKIAKRFGTSEESEEAITEGDIIRFKLTEDLKEGIEREAVEVENVIPFDMLTEAGVKKFEGKKVGKKFKFNPYKGINKTEAEINKMVLMNKADGIDDLNPSFNLEITKVNRVKPAELNQELFDKVFGKDEVKTEEEFRNKLIDEISKSNDYYSTQLLHNEYLKTMMDKTQFELPEEFLKKLFTSNLKEPLSDEEVENEFPKFVEGTKWNLLRSSIAKAKNIEVNDEDIHQFAHKDVERQLMQYAPQLLGNHDQLHDFAHRMLQDKKYVEEAYMKVLDEKIFEALDNTFEHSEQEVTVDEFNEIVKQG